MRKMTLSLALLGMVLVQVGTALAAPSSKPPCGTNGPLKSTELTPSTYSYVQTGAGEQTATFTVSSPAINITGSCDPELSYVYGNGDSGNEIEVAVRVADIYSGEGNPPNLTDEQLAAFKSSFLFNPANFVLYDPGKGSATVTLTFTNSGVVPPGEYLVNIQAKIANPELEKGLGIGPANRTFSVTVTEPQVVILDTLAPVVTITSPENGSYIRLNAPLHVVFSAEDPFETGAGTGVWAMRTFVTNCAENLKLDISDKLSITPSLSIVAGTTALAVEDITAGQIGTFTLKSEADDNALPVIHTGSDVRSFTVGVGVTTLPPLSVTGRQFKSGSNIAIKWVLSDFSGAYLPPFASIQAVVTPPSGASTTYVAGDGSGFIRATLDAAGNAYEYIANYKPSEEGTYKVEIRVDDLCGLPAKQGEFTFYVAAK